MRYHYKLRECLYFKKADHTKPWWGCRVTRIFVHCWWECKIMQTLWKAVQQLVRQFPNHPETLLLGVNPREMKVHFHTNSRAWMFTALFITVKETTQMSTEWSVENGAPPCGGVLFGQTPAYTPSSWESEDIGETVPFHTEFPQVQRDFCNPPQRPSH